MNLDAFERELTRQMDLLIGRRELRIVALVDVGADPELEKALAKSCAGVAHPVIAVFEMDEVK